MRPHVAEIIDSYDFLAQIDLIQAKDQLAESMRATAPHVADAPVMDWIEARHPLLELVTEQFIPNPIDVRTRDGLQRS